jgi:hypothetical protein
LNKEDAEAVASAEEVEVEELQEVVEEVVASAVAEVEEEEDSIEDLHNRSSQLPNIPTPLRD